ncbi:hypothetical protein GYMLUDRAFT_584333 [Collybiopsis luxurians FD-317 M1]|uniref:Uncharacterized protein n=1 Tax=Collybiopsis luxurians FD-317 M1 TaxID=944289 RepID=A0A0D0BCZ2_9AGAR|nr:hypothetical protein GYMLUDRAFT_584333 [Collybiopsis luxurians FD-317 M1]
MTPSLLLHQFRVPAPRQVPSLFFAFLVTAQTITLLATPPVYPCPAPPPSVPANLTGPREVSVAPAPIPQTRTPFSMNAPKPVNALPQNRAKTKKTLIMSLLGFDTWKSGKPKNSSQRKRSRPFELPFKRSDLGGRMLLLLQECI